MQDDTLHLTATTPCALRGGPCLAGHAFLERLSHALGLARRVTGTTPEMAGTVTLRGCPALAACPLRWQSTPEAVELAHERRVLLRGHLAPAVVQ